MNRPCTTMPQNRNIAIAFPFKKICSKWFGLVGIKAMHKNIINDVFGKGMRSKSVFVMPVYLFGL